MCFKRFFDVIDVSYNGVYHLNYIILFFRKHRLIAIFLPQGKILHSFLFSAISFSYFCAMQAIIPVAGAGTHLRPHTYTQPKALIAVAGKPILAYIIESLQQNGITDFVFIIGYLGEKIQEFVQKEFPQLNVKFVWQEERNGLGHAIWKAKAEIDLQKPLVIQLGDTILETNIPAILSSEISTIATKKVADPRAFGVAEIDKDGFISSVDEKPAIPTSNMAQVGFYFIRETQLLFDVLDKQMQTVSGEKCLTYALQAMLERGITFRSYMVDYWFDVGKKDVLLETNAILLRKKGEQRHDESVLENSVLIPPYYISKGAKIYNAVIGPNVSIGENSEIRNSIISNSVIGSFTILEYVTLHTSLVGSDSSIKGLSQSLNIGDNTDIDLQGES